MWEMMQLAQPRHVLVSGRLSLPALSMQLTGRLVDMVLLLICTHEAAEVAV